MADPTFRSSQTQDLNNPASITLSQPSGSLAADTEVALIVAGNAGGTPNTWSAPAGWAAVGASPWLITVGFSKFRFHLWTAAGSVSWSGTFTKSGSSVDTVGVVNEAWSNVSGATPVDVVASSPTGGSGVSSVTVPSVTTVTDRARELIAFATISGGNSFSASGFTADLNAAVNIPVGLLRSNAVKTPAGATGSVVVTLGISGDDAAGIAFALRPAAGGGLFLPSQMAGLGSGGPFFPNPIGRTWRPPADVPRRRRRRERYVQIGVP